MLNVDDMTVDELKRELKDCRNELCYRCGSYRSADTNACQWCRWRLNNESNA